MTYGGFTKGEERWGKVFKQEELHKQRPRDRRWLSYSVVGESGVSLLKGF